VGASKLQVTWKDTVNHTGKLRIALSIKPINLATRADFNANILYEATDTNSVSGGLVCTTITVPDTPCTNVVVVVDTCGTVCPNATTQVCHAKLRFVSSWG
jgi:hypothetical protein